ncbi:MAG: DUF4956 domain-containing protein [candidate division FCPU426 bacterium]
MELLQEFLEASEAPASWGQLLPNLGLAWLLCWILGRFYIRFGSAISDRRIFAGNFIIMGMTTVLVISIVKSSLTLSLGLVGALGIVRFRTLVKEPEELTYLFVTIVVGLGIGASQPLMTTEAFFIILAALWVQSRRARPLQAGYFVVVNSPKLDVERARDILASHALEATLKRLDEGPGGREISFLARFENPKKAAEAVKALKKADPQGAVSLLEHRGELS